MAEGAPLLREYRVLSFIEGSNPSLSANLQDAKHKLQIKIVFKCFHALIPPFFIKSNAPVAQLDRVLGYEPRGREFESLRAHHLLNIWWLFPFLGGTHLTAKHFNS